MSDLGTESVRINQTAFKLSGDKFYSCEHSTEVSGNNVTAIFDHVKLSVFRTEASGNEGKLYTARFNISMFIVPLQSSSVLMTIPLTTWFQLPWDALSLLSSSSY